MPNFLAEVVSYYEDKGFNIEVVCPFNETQYEWSASVGLASQSGTKALNSEVAEASRIINQTFEDKGVNADIMVTEAGQLPYLYEGNSETTNQLNDFFDPSSDNYIGNLSKISNHIAGHSYFTNQTVSGSISVRENIQVEMQQFGFDFWQTEYSMLGTAYQQGKNINDLDEIDYALWLSKMIHTDLVFANATGWSYWTALNRSTFQDHPYRFNLILYDTNVDDESQTDGSFEVVKPLWALGNYSRFVRPGMIRFDVSDSAYESEKEAVNEFMVSGYKSQNENTIVVVFTNNTDESRAVNFENNQLLEEYQLQLFTTSVDKDLEMSDVSIDDIMIPAKSIVTLEAIK